MLKLAETENRTPGFDDRRLHLLESAARVFSEVGYDGASMRRIAAEAEVSPAGIYNYVTGKEEILYWIQYHTFNSLLQDLGSSLEGIVDPKERLATAVRNHVRHFGEHMHELKVCARELETLEGEAYRVVQERRRTYFEAVHQLVKDLKPESKPESGLDSWIATANLFGMINWFYQWYDAGRSQVSLDDLAAQQTALFLDGFFASTSSGDDGDSGPRGVRGGDDGIQGADS
ncbi:MAG: TetR/AcrR family transcriptional regulator [Gemmatimonadota bacterium]|jgi:AcrR family transcriptional regulator